MRSRLGTPCKFDTVRTGVIVLANNSKHRRPSVCNKSYRPPLESNKAQGCQLRADPPHIRATSVLLFAVKFASYQPLDIKHSSECRLHFCSVPTNLNRRGSYFSTVSTHLGLCIQFNFPQGVPIFTLRGPLDSVPTNAIRCQYVQQTYFQRFATVTLRRRC